MPIRPIDLQVAIPKMSEVSRLTHLEQQKAGLHQDQQSKTTLKASDREGKTVIQSQKDSKTGSEADARKKGRNEYVNIRKESEKKQPPKSKNKIDIRI